MSALEGGVQARPGCRVTVSSRPQGLGRCEDAEEQGAAPPQEKARQGRDKQPLTRVPGSGTQPPTPLASPQYCLLCANGVSGSCGPFGGSSMGLVSWPERGAF